MSYDWSRRSRELELSVDAEGRILWCDPRAAQILGVRSGMRLDAIALSGSEGKVAALLARAPTGSVEGWELSALLASKPGVLSVCTQPGDDGAIHLLGLVLPDGYSSVVEELSGSLAEIVDLNRELGRQNRRVEIQNRELDESNRAIRALHAELEVQAETLKRAADVKGRVVANVSHEFRTPLHAILGLTRLLLDGTDPLVEEQRKQIRFVRASAEELSVLIDDMLDLSRIESGRAQIHSERFAAVDLFGTLRGMLRPLVRMPERVELVFEEVPAELVLETDHGKVAQVLRNLISNALKFTLDGEIRVTAETVGDDVRFSVVDTGVGIAPEHLDTVFEEFGQIDHPLQRLHKGTGLGLGLSLSRKLAERLGGTLAVDSTLGVGSTFVLTVPRQHPEVEALARISERGLDPVRTPILVVEDDRKTIFVYEKYLALAGFQAIPARSTDHARSLLETLRPAAIMLDVMLEGETSWSFLEDIKDNPATADIPVFVVTVTGKASRARALGADEFWLKPLDPNRLIRKLRNLTHPRARPRILVIDDDERSRYVVRKMLEGTPYEVTEASTGAEGLGLARADPPDVILLDFLLRDETAFDVLDALEADPRTRSVPVVVVTSHTLDATELTRLEAQTGAVLSKQHLSQELAILRIRDALEMGGLAAPQAVLPGATRSGVP